MNVAKKSEQVQHLDILRAALAYAARGWSIIPIKNVGENKKPACPRWKGYQTNRPDEPTLRQLFSREGITGLAVILGLISGGLVVRDFDLEDSYHLWAAQHRDLAKHLPTVETKRGFHIYFRGPSRYADLEDGEYRGDSGHYCLCPPSRHPAGTVYRWIVPLPKVIPVVNPFEAGLLPSSTEGRGHTESAEDTEDTEDTGDATLSLAPSAPSALSVCHEHIDAVERTILAALPTGEGRRHRAVFELARGLKALPHLADADLTDLKPIVRRWHQLALPVIRTKPFEETWLDFADGWQRVKYPAGAGPLEMLWRQALAEAPPSAALDYEQAGVRNLVAFCRQLQRQAGQGAFFLACRTAGTLLGVHYRTAWSWLQLLEIDGVLHRVTTGSKVTKRANEYRYILE
jgi:hypothetical protein